MDGIILAAAGVKRLGLEKYISTYLNKNMWIPAIGQGAIGIETKKDNKKLNKFINKLNHQHTSICVNAEREISKFFNASCNTPIAAYAETYNNNIYITSMIGNTEGNKKIYSNKEGSLNNAQEIGHSLAIDLEKKGARDFL